MATKSIICISIGLLISSLIYSQELKKNHNEIVISKQDLYTAYNDYIKTDNTKNSIVLIDYLKDDSISVFTIIGSIDIFEVFFKKPDCYFVDKDKIVYVFTEEYRQQKDSIWLNELLQQTRHILNYPSIDISWEKDSIISIGDLAFLDFIYCPTIFKYHVSEGRIIEKTVSSEMLYPDTGYPKGILIFR